MPISDSDLLYYETHYLSADADWVLFVHGAGGSTVTWRRQIADMGIHFNLLLIDLPGHGKMANRSNDHKIYTFQLIGEKIWEVADYLRIPAVHLVGVSLGCIICLEMRDSRPGQVLSIVKAGAITRLNSKLKILASLSLGMAKIIGYKAFYKMSARIMMPRQNHKKSRDIFTREAAVISDDEFRKWTNMYFGLNKTLKRLFNKASDVPHYLVMGAQDHLFLKPALDYANQHSNAFITVFDKCGHVVSIEQAGKFNHTCILFLKQVQQDKPAKDLFQNNPSIL